MVQRSVVCAALALVFTAVTAPLLAWGDDRPIVLGAVFNINGPQSVLDVPGQQGAALATARINRTGGVAGKPLSLRAIDGDSNPRVLDKTVAQALQGDKGAEILALFGLADTDNARAAGTAAEQAGRVFLTSGATSPRLPAELPNIFLACFGDNVQAAAAAEWAFGAQGLRTVHVLVDESQTYPRLLQKYFVDRFTGLGGTVVATNPVEPSDQSPSVPDVGEVDFVFLSVETAEDAMRLVPLLRDGGYKGPILGGDGYDASEVWAAHPNASDIFFTTHVWLGPENTRPATTAFLTAWNAAHPDTKPTAFAALAYDAVGLLAAAIGAVGADDPGRISAGLEGLSGYRGATGEISFAGESRIPLKPVAIVEVANGELRFIENRTPQVVPSP